MSWVIAAQLSPPKPPYLSNKNNAARFDFIDYYVFGTMIRSNNNTEYMYEEYFSGRDNFFLVLFKVHSTHKTIVVAIYEAISI